MADEIDKAIAEDPEVAQTLAESAPQLSAIQELLALSRQELEDAEASSPEGPSDLNRSIFTILSAAIPTALGTALGGRDGALAGLAGSKDTADTNLKSELAREAAAIKANTRDIEAKRKRVLDLEKLINGEGLRRERDEANIKLKARIDPNKTEVNVYNKIQEKVDTEFAKSVQKDWVDANRERMDRLPRAVRILNVIKEGRKSGDFAEKGEDTLIKAVARNVLGRIKSGSTAAELRRAIMDDFVRTLSELIKGNPSANEAEYIKTAQGVGNTVTLDTIEEGARLIISRLNNNLLSVEKLAADSEIAFPKGIQILIKKRTGDTVSLGEAGSATVVD